MDDCTEGRYQRMIGVFVNHAKQIHKIAPQCDEDLKRLIMAFGNMADTCSETVPKEPLRCAMIKKVFSEE